MTWNGFILLVSFYTPLISSFNDVNIKDLSYYDGVAVPIVTQFSTNSVIYDGDINKKDIITTDLSKKIWPWIFVNRIVGHNNDGRTKYKQADKLYFNKINGLDLYNKFGALEDFYQIYTAALLTCKNNGSRGIVIDPETYNNYNAQRIEYIAKKYNKTGEDIKIRLNQVGRKLITIADTIMPDVTIWFLYTELAQRPSGSERKMISYIVEGMLREISENKLSIKIISGGERHIGYCSLSMAHLSKKIIERDRKYQNFTSSYKRLYLAAPFSPWESSDNKSGWMKKNSVCKKSAFKNIDDFEEKIAKLKKSYDYIWIYAAKSAEYNPYDPERSKIFNALLK